MRFFLDSWNEKETNCVRLVSWIHAPTCAICSSQFCFVLICMQSKCTSQWMYACLYCTCCIAIRLDVSRQLLAALVRLHTSSLQPAYRYRKEYTCTRGLEYFDASPSWTRDHVLQHLHQKPFSPVRIATKKRGNKKWGNNKQVGSQKVGGLHSAQDSNLYRSLVTKSVDFR